MKTYTQALSLLNSLSKTDPVDTTSTNILSDLYNGSIRTICNIRGGKWWFLEATKTIATVASQMDYPMPASIRKLTDLYVTVGTTVYRPEPVYDAEQWSKILQTQMASSDIPQYFYPNGNLISIYPAPSSTAGTITVKGRRNIIDQSIADYTTGTISAVTTGTKVITGSGTVWTSQMVGRFIKINLANTVNTGDGMWYEIAQVTSATSLTLVANYEGPTISGGSIIYTIGQVSPIPEAYELAPIYRTLAIFLQKDDPTHQGIADAYWRLYDGGQERGLSNMVGGLVGQMLENEGASFEDVYISPNSRDNLDPNNPPRYPLTGF